MNIRKYVPLMCVLALFVLLVVMGMNAYSKATTYRNVPDYKLKEVDLAFIGDKGYLCFKRGFDDWSKFFLPIIGFMLAELKNKVKNGRKKNEKNSNG